MDNHPDIRTLPTPPPTPHDKLTAAKAQAIQWGILIAVMLALPAIVWLWRWAI